MKLILLWNYILLNGIRYEGDGECTSFIILGVRLDFFIWFSLKLYWFDIFGTTGFAWMSTGFLHTEREDLEYSIQLLFTEEYLRNGRFMSSDKEGLSSRLNFKHISINFLISGFIFRLNLIIKNVLWFVIFKKIQRTIKIKPIEFKRNLIMA